MNKPTLFSIVVFASASFAFGQVSQRNQQPRATEKNQVGREITRVAATAYVTTAVAQPAVSAAAGAPVQVNIAEHLWQHPKLDVNWVDLLGNSATNTLFGETNPDVSMGTSVPGHLAHGVVGCDSGITCKSDEWCCRHDFNQPGNPCVKCCPK